MKKTGKRSDVTNKRQGAESESLGEHAYSSFHNIANKGKCGVKNSLHRALIVLNSKCRKSLTILLKKTNDLSKESLHRALIVLKVKCQEIIRSITNSLIKSKVQTIHVVIKAIFQYGQKGS